MSVCDLALSHPGHCGMGSWGGHHMASEVNVTRDNEFEVKKLDPFYDKTLERAKSAANYFDSYKIDFKRILKKAGAGDSLPMKDKDYKILSEAKDLENLVKELLDLQDKADDCLKTMHFAPSIIREQIPDDVDDIAKVKGKILKDQIQDIEQKIEKLQTERAALQDILSKALKEIETLLDSRVAPLIIEAEKIKKHYPEYHYGWSAQPFGLDKGQKYLKAKLK
jgi:hypothetical protein